MTLIVTETHGWIETYAANGAVMDRAEEIFVAHLNTEPGREWDFFAGYAAKAVAATVVFLAHRDRCDPIKHEHVIRRYDDSEEETSVSVGVMKNLASKIRDNNPSLHTPLPITPHEWIDRAREELHLTPREYAQACQILHAVDDIPRSPSVAAAAICRLVLPLTPLDEINAVFAVSEPPVREAARDITDKYPMFNSDSFAGSNDPSPAL